ncbi:MAG: cyanophycin synthetase [Candidatus Peribacteraceae bacterium]
MKIFCSGIGGIGLSAYAALQKANGHDVSGSDRAGGGIVDDLHAMGIRVTDDQSGNAIPPDTELFVYSEAIPDNAPERKRASNLHIPQKSYPEALSALMQGKRVIAVCGTHGKSSTTAMAARLLMESGLDPTVVVGTRMKELQGRNWRKGEGEWFVVEACEYRRSFLHYAPRIILLTNCDGDHFDYYASVGEYRKAFAEFIGSLSEDGTVIAHANDEDSWKLVKDSGKRSIDADAFPSVRLHTPGEHQRSNARLVLALATILEVPQADAKKSLSGYAGSWRRMDILGTTEFGVTIINDYAHHPVEIRATIAAVREAYPQRRLVCVFQPHTHDRTIKLYKDFISSFRGTDVVIIPDIYEARNDRESGRVDIQAFVADIEKGSDVETYDGSSLEGTEALLRTTILKNGDVLLVMGAGSVTNLATAMAVESSGGSIAGGGSSSLA